ncbi:hypothetical protein [Marinicrinis sediminis]|uniref:Uncharacterized protein n=1 Tax=Marinicrinis sediminis TaxID=1652465 RepID=A0ABW5R8E0_9BACL
MEYIVVFILVGLMLIGWKLKRNEKKEAKQKGAKVYGQTLHMYGVPGIKPYTPAYMHFTADKLIMNVSGEASKVVDLDYTKIKMVEDVLGRNLIFDSKATFTRPMIGNQFGWAASTDIAAIGHKHKFTFFLLIRYLPSEGEEEKTLIFMVIEPGLANKMAKFIKNKLPLYTSRELTL